MRVEGAVIDGVETELLALQVDGDGRASFRASCARLGTISIRANAASPNRARDVLDIPCVRSPEALELTVSPFPMAPARRAH